MIKPTFALPGNAKIGQSVTLSSSTNTLIVGCAGAGFTLSTEAPDGMIIDLRADNQPLTVTGADGGDVVLTVGKSARFERARETGHSPHLVWRRVSATPIAK